MKLLVLAIIMFFGSLSHCPDHTWASCHKTLEKRMYKDNFHTMHLWKCTCGDEWWIKDSL